MINYIYVDLETTVNGGPEGDSPEAHWKNNEVLLWAWGNSTAIACDPFSTHLLSDLRTVQDRGETLCIVAHNAKFDLKYLMRETNDIDWTNVIVWDTMTWEYRHSGHTEKMISLEKLAHKYNIPFKKTLDLNAILAAGNKMEDIDKDLLSQYAIEDVRVLRDIHRKQLATTESYDMNYLLPLADMELNGMWVDRERATELMITLSEEVQDYEKGFVKHLKQCCEWQDGTPLKDEDFTDKLGTKSKYIKPLAARTLSFLLTGVPKTLQITPKWSVVYKDGFNSYYTGTIPPHFGSNYSNLGYPMSEDILEQDTSWIARDSLLYRKANKLLSTYVGPMLHTSAVQGTIHPKLNPAITGTGRLSSSQPNGQNMPDLARELIVPRSGGVIDEIIEIDFSQLELVAVACISGDKNLIWDLGHGVDIHYNTASKVFGKDNAKTMRKIAKNVNFGVLYGGKANGLSKQTGVDKTTVQKLIDAFYTRYPGVARWQKKIFNDVVDNMEPLDIAEGEQRYASEYLEPFSGRKFKFIEQRSPDWLRHKTGRKWSFSPQQTSNYPIQGFAGGDIVMDALTRFWNMEHEWAYFVMTVHDSIIIEAPPNEERIRRAIDQALKETKEHFNLPIDLQYDLEMGPTWS